MRGDLITPRNADPSSFTTVRSERTPGRARCVPGRVRRDPNHCPGRCPRVSDTLFYFTWQAVKRVPARRPKRRSRFPPKVPHKKRAQKKRATAAAVTKPAPAAMVDFSPTSPTPKRTRKAVRTHAVGQSLPPASTVRVAQEIVPALSPSPPRGPKRAAWADRGEALRPLPARDHARGSSVCALSLSRAREGNARPG